MSDLKTHAWEFPGVYFFSNELKKSHSSIQCGQFQVWANGKLSSEAGNSSWVVCFEGILFRDYSSDKTDAEVVLKTFIETEDPRDIQDLKGFFNVIIIHKTGRKGYLISDLLCSRPQYLYESDNSIASAPSPLAFAEANLSISLNRSSLYELVRFLHNGYNRTLTKEVERLLPGHIYEFGRDLSVKKRSIHKFKQDVNHELSLEDCSSWMYDICRETMEAVLNHPRLKNLDVHLPLTSGLDSRHLLGQLIELEKKPAALRHIKLRKKDYKPVEEMSQALDIPLIAPSIYDLNVRDLLRRWAERSGGLVNFHQFYLLQLKDDVPKAGAIGFTGYLMDKFLGVAPRKNAATDKEIFNLDWNRTYAGKSILKILFSDHKSLASETKENLRDQFAKIEGESWYKMGIQELHNRSLHYTGIFDTMLTDNLFTFSPGASADSLRFFSEVPREIGGDKRARLHALNHHFPELATFPDSDGISFSQQLKRPKKFTSSIMKNAAPFMKFIFSGFQNDPAPETEHAWLRQGKQFHDIHKKVVFDGNLVKDGLISSKGVKTSWYFHNAGGFQAWTLMSILTAEVAYQLLCKQESLDSVIEWLCEDINRHKSFWPAVSSKE